MNANYKPSILRPLKALFKGVFYGIFLSLVSGFLLFYSIITYEQNGGRLTFAIAVAAIGAIFLLGLAAGGGTVYLIRFRRSRKQYNSAVNITLNYANSLIEQENYDDALKLCRSMSADISAKRDPVAFSRIKKTEAFSYLHKSHIADKEENLEKALVAFQEAVLALPWERFSTEHGKLWSSIGNVYLKLHELNNSHELVQLAKNAFEYSIQSIIQKKNPGEYACNHVKYSLASEELARYENREENLDDALGGYNTALKTYTQNAYPLDYAMTQNSIGSLYLKKAESGDPETNLRHAITAFDNALTVYSPEKYPLDHKVMLENIKKAESRMDTLKRAPIQ